MLPVAPLMIEHRLIERMIKLMDGEVARIKQGGSPDTEFIDKAVDFIKTYADKLHHGKEEDILFRDLSKKDLTPAHRKTMDELVHEHVLGRANTKKLVEGRNKYKAGDNSGIKEILENMEILAKFYPKHIEKEDKHFFLPVMDYFDKQEKDAMLCEFTEFDRKFIHDKYKAVVEEIENHT